MDTTFDGGASAALYRGDKSVTIRVPLGLYAQKREALAGALGVASLPENPPQGRENAAWVNAKGVMAGPAPAVAGRSGRRRGSRQAADSGGDTGKALLAELRAIRKALAE